MPGFSTAWALYGLERGNGSGLLPPRTHRPASALKNLFSKGRA